MQGPMRRQRTNHALWQQIAGWQTLLVRGESLQAFAQSGSCFAEYERILINLRVKPHLPLSPWRQTNLF